MTLMSRKVDYALLILSHLHNHPEGACAREIAGRFNLSRAFVANILKLLCQKGLVTSHRGVKGGYFLQRPAEQVHLAELMDALDEPFHLAECSKEHADPCAHVGVCTVRGAIGRVHQRIRDVLREVTLAELFRSVEETPTATRHGFELALVGN